MSADSSLLEANLAALSRSNPELSKAIEQWRNKRPELPDYVWAEMGKREMPTLKARDAAGEFYLHSPYDPHREAMQWVEGESENFSARETAIVLGFGLGYLAEALLEQEVPERIICVEPSVAIFAQALSQRDLSSMLANERLNLVVGLAPREAGEAVALRLNKRQMYGWRPMIMPAMARLHLDFAKRFTPAISGALTALQTARRTKINKADLFMGNALSNLPLMCLCPGVEVWRGQHRARPAVLVAAGPSLDKQLPLLREYADRVLVIAVGQAWRSLREAGIEPHVVMSVDPGEHNLVHFEGMQGRGAVLVADAGSHPAIPAEFDGPVLFHHSRPDGEELFSALCGPRGVLDTGGSVANTAFSMARLLQADPIILIGQDLAFTGGQTHASGNAHKRDLGTDLAQRKNLRPVPGYDGGTVYTNAQMDAYRVWFERVIAKVDDARVFNATEGGARIEGVAQQPFAELLERFAGEATDAQQLSRLARPVESVDGCHKRIVNMQRQLAHMASKANEVAHQAARLATEENAKAKRDLAKSIKQGGKVLTRGKPESWLLLSAFLTRESFAVRTLAEEQEKKEDFATIARRYYEAIEQHATVLVGRLEELDKRLMDKAFIGAVVAKKAPTSDRSCVAEKIS